MKWGIEYELTNLSTKKKKKEDLGPVAFFAAKKEGQLAGWLGFPRSNLLYSYHRNIECTKKC